MGRRVLFGTSSWGLGHATRDLVLLRALLDAGCDVTVVATGAALRVLEGELGERCRFVDWPDMPSTIARSTVGFYFKTVAFIPGILWRWFTEKYRIRRWLGRERFDVLISDHRYGMVSGKLPCYFITHSPRYIAPWRSWFMETCMEFFVARWLSPVEKVLIPDEPTPGLSGDMSHRTRFLPSEKKVFLGFLSSVAPTDDARDIDVFISISGPEPQRSRLQAVILPQLERLAGQVGRIVVTLGMPGQAAPSVPVPAGVEVHAYLGREQQQAMMNRSRLVVCRSGYTTLMELARLGRPALLIPTPGQTEQLYLARTLKEQGRFHSVAQDELDLLRDIARARELPGVRATMSAQETRRIFLETVGLATDERGDDRC